MFQDRVTGRVTLLPAAGPELAEALRLDEKDDTARFYRGQAYLRLGRPNVPIIYEKDCPFTLGKANKVTIDKENTTIVNGAGKKKDIEGRIAQIKAEIEETLTTTARSCRNGWRSLPAASQ